MQFSGDHTSKCSGTHIIYLQYFSLDAFSMDSGMCLDKQVNFEDFDHMFSLFSKYSKVQPIVIYLQGTGEKSVQYG